MMIRNHLRMAVRNLKRHKLHAFINLLGLTIGLSCTTVITLFLIKETSFDKYHSNSDHIYRIAHDRTLNGSFRQLATTPLYLADQVKENLPELTHVGRFMQEQYGLMQKEEERIPETRFVFVDPAILEMFDIPLISGDKSTALSDPSAMILSQSMAQKYFGEKDPIGLTLTWENWGREFVYQITGVFEDIPDNSHFHFDFFVPYDSQNNLWKGMHGQDWYYSGAWTYVQLAPTSTTENIEAQLANLVEQNIPSPLGESTQLYLQPLQDIHLTSNLGSEIQANGSLTTVYIFSVVAVMILLISCINFINLSTAKALTRSKEVGVRKTLGAARGNLIFQLLSESTLVSLIASILSIGLTLLTLPVFNSITEQNITLNPIQQWPLILLIILSGLILGIVSGTYPALFLSNFNTIKALKISVYSGVDKGFTLRRMLVALQFAISIILLIGVNAITKQINYMKEKDLGFDQDQVIFLNGFDFRQYPNLKNELAKITGVTSITGGNSVPGSPNATPIVRMFRTEDMTENDRIEAQVGTVDFDYLDFLGVEFLKGRNFSEQMGSDEAEAIIVNETFLQQLGIDPEDYSLKVDQYNMMGDYANTKTIIGVIKDFHTESLHTPIKPFVINLRTDRLWFSLLKVRPQNLSQTMQEVQAKIKPFSNGQPADVFFLDQDIARLYERESQLSKLVSTFTFLAIFISCLGLLGLASFMTAQKTKEIGIRKVLGASVSNLIVLLTKRLTILVGISFVIGVPFAYYALSSWLNNFAYKTTLDPWLFLSAGLLTIIITWLTVGYQSFKAAIINPIKSLRDE